MLLLRYVSRSGDHFIYRDGAFNVWLVDLSTMSRRNIGSGTDASFLDMDHVVINSAPNAKTYYDIRSGQLSSAPPPKPPSTSTPTGISVTVMVVANKGFEDVYDAAGKPLFRVLDSYEVKFADPETLLVVTQPLCNEGSGNLLDCGDLAAQRSKEPKNPDPASQIVRGTMNLFLVNIASGSVSFIATTPYEQFLAGISRPQVLPIVANSDYVAWTDDYCQFPSPGRTRVFNRTTGMISELNTTLWPQLNGGTLLGVGIGPKLFIRLTTFMYEKPPLPEGTSTNVSWSADYRYAVANPLARDGPCFP